MFPTLGDLFGILLAVPTHDTFVGLGVMVAVAVFIVETRRRDVADYRLLYVVTGALVGGAIFMRLGPLLQHLDLGANPRWRSNGSMATARSLAACSVPGSAFM